MEGAFNSCSLTVRNVANVSPRQWLTTTNSSHYIRSLERTSSMTFQNNIDELQKSTVIAVSYTHLTLPTTPYV